jgi:hypothetical protein
MIFIFVTLIAILAAISIILLRAARAVNKNTQLHRVDTLALRNLLSEEDEDYLRASLNSSEYRQLRRARLRAIQEYLVWIAQDCSNLLQMIQSSSGELIGSASIEQVERLSKAAIRLRLFSSGFWLLCWLEYLIPQLSFRPMRMLRTYEEFWRSAELYARDTGVRA